ncbi:hypothetical protein EI555_017481, partial [Monodon monoceros]
MGTLQKDVIIKSDAPDTLLLEKHADYIASYGSEKDDYILTPSDGINVIDGNKVVECVQSLQKEDGSFAGDIWGTLMVGLVAGQVLNPTLGRSIGTQDSWLLPVSCIEYILIYLAGGFVNASLRQIIGRLPWIDREKLRSFTLACQDEETGGFADRPGDMVDPFHTVFGIAGLSPLGEEQIKPVSPVFCMPEEVLR